MFWRLFRAPDLAFWTLAVLTLGGLLVVAANLGSSPDAAAHAPGHAALRPATSSAAGPLVDDLHALMPAGNAAGTDPQALTSWATELQELTRDALDIRYREGATTADPLVSGLTELRTLTDTLEQVVNDPVVATSTRTQIGLQASRLAALVHGLPAPGLPQGAQDPLGQRDAAPTVPDTRTPARPQTPEPPTVDRPNQKNLIDQLQESL